MLYYKIWKKNTQNIFPFLSNSNTVIKIPGQQTTSLDPLNTNNTSILFLMNSYSKTANTFKENKKFIPIQETKPLY